MVFTTEKQKKQAGQKLVGGYFPLPLSNYLKLQALARGISLQDMLLNIVTEWTENQTPDFLLCDDIAEKAKDGWVEKMKNKEFTYGQEAYLLDVKAALTRKRINESHTRLIVTKTKTKIQEWRKNETNKNPKRASGNKDK